MDILRCSISNSMLYQIQCILTAMKEGSYANLHQYNLICLLQILQSP